MLELSKMQGLAGGSRAPLGLLLICLYLQGLFARSIEAPEEKISLHSGKPSFTSLFNSGQPQPKPDSVNNELPRVLPRLPEFPQDGALPEGGSEMPSQPAFWGWSPVESWFSEDPQQGMEAAIEDHLQQVPPEALPYFSRGMASSAYEASGPEDSQPAQLPGFSPLGTEAEAFAQHPFWFFIHRLFPGLPWRILSPSGSWGGGWAGTGWGRRPMPYPGIWGSNSQLSGTNLGVNGRRPGVSWGTNGPYPSGSWGGNRPNPAGSWGGNRPYPAGSWGSNRPYPGSWGSNRPYPGSWGSNRPYPGSWGSNRPYPGSWGANGGNQLPPGVRPPGRNQLPPGVRPPGRNQLPPGVRHPGRNQLPPGARPSGSSGSLPDLSLQ